MSQENPSRVSGEARVNTTYGARSAFGSAVHVMDWGIAHASLCKNRDARDEPA